MRGYGVLRVFTAIAFILPLGMDTLALSAALGLAGMDARDRLRTSLIFSAFETVMPIVGFLAGSGIGTVAGRVSGYAAGGVFILLGIYMLWQSEGEEEEAERVRLLQRTRGAAVLGLGLSVSLDELAIGFGGGLLRLPLLLLALIIGLQAFLAAQIGMRFGARLGEETREWGERAAGALLIAAGILALVEQAAEL